MEHLGTCNSCGRGLTFRTGGSPSCEYCYEKNRKIWEKKEREEAEDAILERAKELSKRKGISLTDAILIIKNK